MVMSEEIDGVDTEVADSAKMLPYVNQNFYDMLGAIPYDPKFPTNETVFDYYLRAISLPPDVVVLLVMKDAKFLSYMDIIAGAMHDMEMSGIGFALTQFIDLNFPDLMERLNTNEDEFEWLKMVVTMLVERIRAGL